MLGPGAKLHYALPEDMRMCRAPFDAMSEVEKRQFYLIGNLVTMAEANTEYSIFDRSFASTVAYARGTLAAHLQHPLDRPAKLKWPAALRPNHYFYLTCDESVRRERLQGRNVDKTDEENRLAESTVMRDEIDWSYRNFEGVQEIDVSQLNQDEVTERIFSAIQYSV